MNVSVYYHLLGSNGLATSLSSQVAGELGRCIVSGIYQCGDLVEDENTAAKRFDVSRTVIREAVKILSTKGLITVRRGIGTRVTPRSDWRLLDEDVLAWMHAAPPCAKTLAQLMEIRMVLEPNAACWAAQRASDEDKNQILAAVSRMDDACSNAESFVIADAEFHRAILHAAHNDFLTALEGAIYTALLMSIRLTNKTATENKESVLLHHPIAEAIAKSDSAAAEKCMRYLLNNASERLSATLPTTAAPEH